VDNSSKVAANLETLNKKTPRMREKHSLRECAKQTTETPSDYGEGKDFEKFTQKEGA